jgi:hypothetical protein
MEVLPGARHRDVKETALFLNLLSGADRHVRGDAAVDHIEHENNVSARAGDLEQLEQIAGTYAARGTFLRELNLRSTEASSADEASVGRCSPH